MTPQSRLLEQMTKKTASQSKKGDLISDVINLRHLKGEQTKKPVPFQLGNQKTIEKSNSSDLLRKNLLTPNNTSPQKTSPAVHTLSPLKRLQTWFTQIPSSAIVQLNNDFELEINRYVSVLGPAQNKLIDQLGEEQEFTRDTALFRQCYKVFNLMVQLYSILNWKKYEEPKIDAQLSPMVQTLRTLIYTDLNAILTDLVQLSIVSVVPLETNYRDLNQQHFKITGHKNTEPHLRDRVNLIQTMGLIDTSNQKVFKATNITVCQ